MKGDVLSRIEAQCKGCGNVRMEDGYPNEITDEMKDGELCVVCAELSAPGPNRLTAADMRREEARVNMDRFRGDLERAMDYVEEACRVAREEARG